MPAVLEKFRGSNAGSQYVRLLKGEEPQGRSYTGKAVEPIPGRLGDSPTKFFPRGLVTFLYYQPLGSLMKLLDLFLR